MSSPPPPPGDGAPPPALPLEPIPFEDRERRGFVGSLIPTGELFLFRPREGFRRARRTGDLLSPILWVAMLGFASTVVQAFWSLLLSLAMAGVMQSAEAATAQTLLSLVQGGVMSVLSPFLAVAGVFVWAGVLHLALMLLGALERSPGFEGSLRAVAYAYTGQVAAVLPGCGGVVGLLWTLVLVVIGLETIHETTTGRALAAVLIPLLLCCLCGGLLAAAFGASIAAAIGQFAPHAM